MSSDLIKALTFIVTAVASAVWIFLLVINIKAYARIKHNLITEDLFFWPIVIYSVALLLTVSFTPFLFRDGLKRLALGFAVCSLLLALLIYQVIASAL
jgi:hypothetical protein